MSGKLSNRAIKREVFSLLGQDNIGNNFSLLLNYPLRRVVNPLFSALLSPDPKIKWHGVTAFGFVVDRMAKESIEDARVIMRRFMWMLNDDQVGLAGALLRPWLKLWPGTRNLLWNFILF